MSRQFLDRWVPYAVLVSVHFVSGLAMEQPVILADELGYLGNARYLAGVAPLPNMHGSQFYHFGYSLFLLPAFWLFGNPVSVYEVVLVLNALLMSAVYFPLAFSLESHLDVSGRWSRGIAFACSLYPPLVLYSNFAWAENAFVPGFALMTALFGALLTDPSKRHALVLGLVTGFLYVIHPRALPVLAVVASYLVGLALWNVLPKRRVALCLGTVGVLVASARFVNAHLKEAGWGGGGEFSATTLAGRLVPGSDFVLLLERASGQMLYLSIATSGLFLIGTAVAIRPLFASRGWTSMRSAAATPRTGVPLFVLVSGSGVFVASCAAKLYSVHGPAGVRGADFIHGRYNEAFAVLMTAVAVAALHRTKPSFRQLALGALGVAATTLCLTVIVAVEVKDAQRRHDPNVPANEVPELVLPSEVAVGAVPGVYPLVRRLGGLRLYAMTLVGLSALVVVTVTLRLSSLAGLVVLMLLFGATAVENHRHFIVPAIENARPRLTFVSQILRTGPLGVVSYDAAHQESSVFYGAQYLMPQTVFRRFDSRKRDIPETEAVISGNKWRQARRLSARFVVSSGWDNALWLLPGERARRFRPPSYAGVVLGTEPRLGVQEDGFYPTQQIRGAPGRWTTGAAALKVPLDPERPPQRLAIETIAPGRESARLRVLANGMELWNDAVPPGGWSKIFDLDGVPMNDELLIELRSDTLRRKRRLGVVVRGILLVASDDESTRTYDGRILGIAPVLGIEESGFYAPEPIEGEPGRWTNGAATLRVPLDPSGPPRRLELATVAPGRDGAELLVVANGVELTREQIPSSTWTKSFDLVRVPMNGALTIELRTDTFTPAERHEGSTDERPLGIAVRAIRLLDR